MQVSFRAMRAALVLASLVPSSSAAVVALPPVAWVAHRSAAAARARALRLRVAEDEKAPAPRPLPTAAAAGGEPDTSRGSFDATGVVIPTTAAAAAAAAPAAPTSPVRDVLAGVTVALTAVSKAIACAATPPNERRALSEARGKPPWTCGCVSVGFSVSYGYARLQRCISITEVYDKYLSTPW